MQRAKKTKRLALLGICTAFAMVLSYLELLLPPIMSSIPGIKMGLANIAIIFVLYRISVRAAISVSVVRVILVSLLFGNAMALAYSIAGALLSLSVMALLSRTGAFSCVGVSVAGAVFHNVGQILMAMLLLGTAELGYYLVVLTVSGVIAGIVIGICGGILTARIPNKLTAGI